MTEQMNERKNDERMNKGMNYSSYGGRRIRVHAV
jgi:hypothetical protein